MSDYRIVPMTMQHTAAVAKLEKLCFSDPWSEASVQSEVNNPLSCWLVAIDGSKVIGYIGSQTAAGESDMMNLAVAPDHRGKGIGASLVNALITELLKRGSSALFLEVRESNLPAIKLYEKLLFQKIGVRPNYYFHPRENAVIMRKELIDLENSCN